MKYKHALYSFLLIIALATFIFLISYPDTQGLGDFFGAMIYYILMLFAGLALGIIALLLRLFRIYKTISNFFYTFTGMLNLSIGILALALIFSGIITEVPFIRLFYLSLCIGLIIGVDLLLHKKTQFKN